MTERSESERAEFMALDPLEMLLDAARYAEGNGGKYSNPEWAKAARAAVAKARLVAPPDSGAGKSETRKEDDCLGLCRNKGCQRPDRCMSSIDDEYLRGYTDGVRDGLADHGGADAGVGVKPLEWEHQNRTMQAYTVSDSRGIDYYINQSFGSDCYYFATVKHNGAILYDGDDLEAAKAAAQADYERRILSALSKPAPVADNASAEATYKVGRWLSAALEDPNVCAEMKADINAWIDAGQPNVQSGEDTSAEAEIKEVLENIQAFVQNNYDHYGRLIETGKGEHGESGYVRDSVWSSWCSKRTMCEGILAVIKLEKAALSAHPHASDCDKQGER